MEKVDNYNHFRNMLLIFVLEKISFFLFLTSRMDHFRLWHEKREVPNLPLTKKKTFLFIVSAKFLQFL